MTVLDARLILDSPQLRREQDALIRAHLLAIKEAVEVTARHLELNLEGITRRSVPGKLWRSWTSGIGPSGGQIALEPAGWVRLNSFREKAGRLSRTYGAMEFFTQEGRITGQNQQWLAIPLPAAGSRGRMRWLTPGEWERKTGVRLRFVYRKGKPALLVADIGTTNARTGAFRPITRKRTAADERRGFVRGAQTVPIFVLVPYVQFGNRFSIQPYIGRAEQELVANGRLYIGRIRSEAGAGAGRG